MLSSKEEEATTAYSTAAELVEAGDIELAARAKSEESAAATTRYVYSYSYRAEQLHKVLSGTDLVLWCNGWARKGNYFQGLRTIYTACMASYNPF